MAPMRMGETLGLPTNFQKIQRTEEHVKGLQECNGQYSNCGKLWTCLLLLQFPKMSCKDKEQKWKEILQTERLKRHINFNIKILLGF